MTDPSVFERLRSLLKSQKSAPDSAFAKQYRAIVDGAHSAGLLTPGDASRLLEMLPAFEGWFGEHSETANGAFNDWLRLYGFGDQRLPRPLAAAFLGRIPAAVGKSFDWTSLLLEQADRTLIDLLVEAKAIKVSDLVRIAKAQPSRFYFAAGLDVLLDRRGVPPRAVWKNITGLAERPAGLIPAAEAIAEAFALDRSVDAPAWLLSFLAEHAELRPGILLQVLRDAPAFERLLNYVAAALPAVAGKKKRVISDWIASVVPDVLRLCEQSVVESRRTAPVASFGVGTLLMAAHSSTSEFPPETVTQIDHVAERVSRHRIVAVLRAAEDGRDGGATPIVASGGDLFAAVQHYIQNLPIAGASETEPAERASRYQRYLGRKEVIEELLPILASLGDDRARRDLDAALFNVGLRPLGAADSHEIFDTRRHESTTSGILPGDTVIIVRPGWQLGEGDGAIPLAKAQVRPQP